MGGVFKRAGPHPHSFLSPRLIAAGNPVDDDALAATMETEIQSPHNHWPGGGVIERRESSDPLIGEAGQESLTSCLSWSNTQLRNILGRSRER